MFEGVCDKKSHVLLIEYRQIRFENGNEWPFFSSSLGQRVGDMATASYYRRRIRRRYCKVLCQDFMQQQSNQYYQSFRLLSKLPIGVINLHRRHPTAKVRCQTVEFPVPPKCSYSPQDQILKNGSLRQYYTTSFRRSKHCHHHGF